jgi:hypothetical protein
MRAIETSLAAQAEKKNGGEVMMVNARNGALTKATGR